MIYVGIDWAEAHHDVCVENEDGEVLTKGRVPDGVEGVERIHDMVGTHAQDPKEVRSGSSSTVVCWSRRSWGPATRCTR